METKIVLSLLVPGAKRLTQEFCEKNPKDSYNEEKLSIIYYKKNKKCREEIIIKTRKNELITHVINIGEQAYVYMLNTPATKNYSKKKWDSLPVDLKLKEHFNLIAMDFRAVSYSYKVLNN